MQATSRISIPAVLLAAALGSACSSDSKGPDQLQLPGDTFFPYSINKGADESIYVGSPATGEIVRFAAGKTTATTIVAASTPAAGVNGILVDDANGVLYTCTNIFTSATSVDAVVRTYDLQGHAGQTYPLPAGALCEELAFDARHRLFAADAWGGTVYVMNDSRSGFTAWTSDPLLLPTSSNTIPFGARGILIQGNDMYLTNFNTGAFVHIAIDADGSAGPATAITVTPPLTNPESVRAIDPQHFVIAEDVWKSPHGLVSELTLGGGAAQKAVLAKDLLGPSTLVIARDSIWVPLGEVWHTLDNTPPDSLPFTVERLDVP